MDLFSDKELDTILDTVCRSSSVSDDSIDDGIILELKRYGYVSEEYVTSLNGRVRRIRATDSGYAFNSEGGFSGQRKKKKDERLKFWIDTVHKSISITALILSIIAVFRSCK